MSSMDGATRNATSLLKKLNTQYNRARQAAITTELIEVSFPPSLSLSLSISICYIIIIFISIYTCEDFLY